MYTCYPRIWLALTPTSIPSSLAPPPPSLRAKISMHLGLANYHVNGIPSVGLCCVFHQAEEPPCSMIYILLLPPSSPGYNPWIIARGAAYSAALYDHHVVVSLVHGHVMSREQFREDKGEEKLGKETRVHRERWCWDNDNGVAAINYHYIP